MKRSSTPRSLTSVVAVLPLLAGCAVDASQATPEPVGRGSASLTGIATSPGAVSTLPMPTPLPLAPPPPAVQPIAAGAGWQHVTVTGSAVDGVSGATVSADGEYYVVHGRSAIASTDMPAATQAALAASMATTPPVAGVDEIIIVPKAASDAAVAASGSAGSGGIKAQFLCGDSDETFSKGYSVNDAWAYAKSTDGAGFTGSIAVNAGVAVRFTGTVDYTVKRHWYFGCVPYAVIHDVTAVGAGTVQADLKANASFSAKWSDETTIANPTLGTITLPVVPIPITFTLPVRVGLDAQAKATLTADASFSAVGAYTIACTSAGCDGTKEGVYGFVGNQAPTVSVTANVKVTPYAEAALHAYIIADELASAEVGLRASLPTDLFGYAGNGCGDADGNGVNEWVSGASVDMSVAADVRAKATFLGFDGGPWSWNVWTQHVGFWSVNGGVFDPMVTGSGNGMTATVRGRMRPCFPFSDAMTYGITWSDGSTSSVTSPPGQLFSSAHAFATGGRKAIRVDAVSDAKGRAIGTSATRDVCLGGLVAPIGGVLVL